jgi:hypothetical protein
MRQLEAEARAARERDQQRGKAAPVYAVSSASIDIPAPAEPEEWPFIYMPVATPSGVCFHGIDMDHTCFACGRLAL